ncbi:MAG: hypothetical protein ABIH01_04535, partial [Candidatus Omnitrophota bacterium]
TDSLPENLTLDMPIIPIGTPNSGDLKLTDGDTVLAGGTYWYTSIDLSGTARLIYTGDTTVYVSGKVTFSGNSFVTTQTAEGNNIPANLTLCITTSSDVKLSGNSIFYGTIYAPIGEVGAPQYSEVGVTGNAAVYGAVIARDIDMSGNAKLHYDEALVAAGSGDSDNWHLISWREVFNP